MQYHRISNTNELKSLKDDWNQLLTCCSASHVPFLRHEYLTTWWQTLGGGEWKDGELCVITAREEDGQLIGIAPLFLTKKNGGEQALLLLGSIEISDYLDFIVLKEATHDFTDGLLNFLSGKEIAGWEILDLYNLLEDSPTIPALESAADRYGFTYKRERLQHCPYIPLPGDWDQYLANINKKQRHEIRRKMRRAKEYSASVNWYIVEDENTLDAEIEDFLDLMAQDPEKEKFLTDIMRSQMRSAVHAAFQAGWLQLAFLETDEGKAAGYLNFDFADHIWVYNSGINFKYRELSPGWVLLGHLLKWANENGRKAFDFMRGDEAYKYRFGAVDRFVERVRIKR